MLLLEAGLIGVFLALDLILFFVFFEVVLVPMYFLIAGWGHDNRRYAAMKFFLFTMAGSAFLFVGHPGLAFLHRSADGLPDVRLAGPHRLGVERACAVDGTAKWLFLAFAVAFAVKVPLFPFHTWLPDAHTEAPTAGSVILAGVLLKMGTYGFLRFAVPMFPQAAVDFAPMLLVLAVIGIIYGAIVAAMQPNLKRLVAYSSVAHLGFVVLGIFALTQQGIQGGVFTMISHGLTTGALFLLVGMLYDRRHTYEIVDSAAVEGDPRVRRPVRHRRRSRRSACPGSRGSSASSSRCSARSSRSRLVRRRRGDRRDPRRRLHAVGRPARVHR